MAIIRFLNGVALACLHPVTQSFVVDLAQKSERGYSFGWLYFFAHAGSILATLFVTPLSTRMIFGMAGWRLASIAIGVASLFVASVLPMLIFEKPRAWRQECFGLRVELEKLRRFLQIPTFVVIILQGVFGTIPGAAMTFSTMYFQYTGISDSMTAMISASSIIGHACGGLLGGVVGDRMASYSPLYGRTTAVQISFLINIPLIYLLFACTPGGEANASSFAGILFVHGLLWPWVAAGCICPYMCDIIPKRNLASAYAWELAIVFASGSSLGPLIVGSLSRDVFGYTLSKHQVSDMDPVHRARNAEALGLSLLYGCVIPYIVCALLFSLMFCTYPRDMKAVEAGNPLYFNADGESQALGENKRLHYSGPQVVSSNSAS